MRFDEYFIVKLLSLLPYYYVGTLTWVAHIRTFISKVDLSVIRCFVSGHFVYQNEINTFFVVLAQCQFKIKNIKKNHLSDARHISR